MPYVGVAYQVFKAVIFVSSQARGEAGGARRQHFLRKQPHCLTGPGKDCEAPHYDNPRKDVALLKMRYKVDMDFYTPICLPFRGMDFTGVQATVIGLEQFLQF